jgi:hypothetical protein
MVVLCIEYVDLGDSLRKDVLVGRRSDAAEFGHAFLRVLREKLGAADMTYKTDPPSSKQQCEHRELRKWCDDDGFIRWLCVEPKCDFEIYEPLDETTGNDVEDAAKWRALRNCARITAMGSAGMERPTDPDAHVTLNFWTHNERETEEYPRKWLDTFVKKALALAGSPEEPSPRQLTESERASFERALRNSTRVVHEGELVPEKAYGDMRYPAQLVLQDIRTLHGRQFKSAALIVASPPCQAYSYRAMPWKRAKALPPPSNELFETCFRIQREAIEAAGHFIPLIVENVRGAQPWVGRSRWNFGSFHLWGDVPALMPMAIREQKFNPDGTNHGTGSWFKIADSKNRGSKNTGGSWFNVAHNTTSGKGNNPDGRKHKDADGYERNHPHALEWKVPRTSSGSVRRKAATALIAKIPLALSSHIARVYRPAVTSTCLTTEELK